MKKFVFILAVLCFFTISAGALLLKTAEPIGAGKTGYEIESSSPMAHIKHQEISAKLTYGINNKLDFYCRAAKQTLPGSSNMLVGAGFKGGLWSVSNDALMDLAWIGDLTLSQSQTIQLFYTGLIAGLLFSRSMGPVTPYGLLGLSTSYAVGGPTGASTQKSSASAAAGITIALLPNLRFKAEGLYSNIYQGANKTSSGFALELIL